MNNYLMNPNIIEETNRGIDTIRMVDYLFENRKICIFGEITDELPQIVISNLLYLDEKSPSTEINMYINSPGGSVKAGLAIYDVMQSISSPVNTICINNAASMAAIIFVTGYKRKIYENSEILIHGPYTYPTRSLNISEIEECYEKIKKSHDKLTEILLTNSICSLDEINKLMSKDSILTSKETLDKGFADEIIQSKPRRKILKEGKDE